MLESIGNVKTVRGQVAYGSLEFEGTKIPVVLAAGASDGPALLVTCLQHATEFSGPAALDRALCDLDLSKLRGVLVGMPAVNPLQLKYGHDEHTAAHKNPETNLNRQWPGEAASDNPFSRLAALLWAEAVRKCDALVDFHCCRKVDPRFAAAAEGHAPSEKLAAAVGLEAVDLQTAESYARGLLFVHAAKDLDKASILVESHPGGFQVREAVEACAGVIFRAMVHLGMLESWRPADRPAAERAPVFRRAEKAAELHNARPGYLAVRRWAGQRAAKGQVVAVVRSLETFEVVEELASPVEGAVASVGDPAGAGLVAEGVVAATVKSAG